jgi:hypothetical protein
VWNLNTLQLVQFNEVFRKKMELKRKEMTTFSLEQMFRSDNPEVVRSRKLVETLQSLFQVGSIDLTTTNSAFMSKSGTIKHQAGVLRIIKSRLGRPLLVSFQRITRVDLPSSPSLSSSSSSSSSPPATIAHVSMNSPAGTQQQQKPINLNLPTYLYPSPSSLAHSITGYTQTPSALNTTCVPPLGTTTKTTLSSSSSLSTLEETISRYPQVNDYLQRVSSQFTNYEELNEDQIALAMRRAKKLCRPNSLKKVSKFCAADLRFRFYEGPNSKRKNKKTGPILPSEPVINE